MKVLVVDDSGPIRKIMGKMLRRMGFEVLEACHGKEALVQLEKHPDIELLTVDWNMPEMNGIELLEAMKTKRGSEPKPTIVMVSTENEKSKIVRAMSKGANEYIMKPFTEEILTEKLRFLGMGGSKNDKR